MAVLDALRIPYLAAGLIVAVLLVPVVMRSKRALDKRIRDFRRELAERQGPPPDPWQELAALYADEGRSRREPRKQKRGR
jgi:hypothetical protein